MPDQLAQLIPQVQRRAISYIRFSSLEQAKGQSLRRQLEESEKYATLHNLVIDESFQDLGKSAFKGSHLKGALGVLLDKAKSGQIPKGTVLIVESLDRLSRAKPRVALRQFEDIIDAGIDVHTISDQKVYTAALLDKDPLTLFGSIMLMVGSHEQSKLKSDRIIDVWNKRRRDILDKPMFGMRPKWLDWNGVRFTINEGRAAVVRRIFQETADHGRGAISIARRLNEEGISVWEIQKQVGDKAKRKRVWTTNMVCNILAARSTFGEFQARRRLEGKREREAVGEIIPDYYPAVIGYELFQRAHLARSMNLGTGGRKTIKNPVLNMFPGRVFCAECGATCYTRSQSNGRNSFVCQSAFENAGCTNRDFNSIRWIEGAIMDGVSVLESHRFLEKPQAGEDELQGQIDRLAQQIETSRRKRTNSLLSFEDDPLPETRDRIRELTREIEEAESRLAGLRVQADRAGRRMTIGEMDEEIRKFRDDCYAADLEVREQARSRMSMILRQLVRSIRIDSRRTAHVTIEGDRMVFKIREGKVFDVVFNVRGTAWRLLDSGQMEEVGPWGGSSQPATPHRDHAAASFFVALARAVPAHELRHPRLLAVIHMKWIKQGKIPEDARGWLAGWLEAHAVEHGIVTPPSIQTALRAAAPDAYQAASRK